MLVKDFIIIGGGIAGFSAIKAIREEDATSSILWITDEDRIPYKRTQVNKHIASGFHKEEFAITSHEWLVNNHVELLYDSVEAIDTEKNELSFLQRGHLRYNKLIITTGNSPRKLSIEGLADEDIFHVNTARQVENIIRASAKAKRFLVFGAGVEGVETASELIKMGKEVTLIDQGSRVLQQFFTPEFSGFIQEAILQTKVKLVLHAKEVKYIQDDLGKDNIQIDGINYPYDAIIASIGYSPNIHLVKETEVKHHRGILVNQYLQSSVSNIYAAGDVAEHPSAEVTGLWHAAEHQGKIAGLNACGHQIELELKPFRMKTSVFEQFFFSFLPKEKNTELLKESNNGIIRHLYLNNDGKLIGVLMQNDKERAKIYQKALMEKWTLPQIHELLPI
ncbi:NAD(P)/FAD-dependent oxidoreductase [Labilibacter marinus]|uniref:NAD(P)/FAD-dependent oxidoreductase n=1 Tax=Labilibacter marinus TaxID=1477105 RepID=UPI0009500F46|nr:FAD/NAD(P)-binding oxidoreductase [Labilibacter marinus]